MYQKSITEDIRFRVVAGLVVTAVVVGAAWFGYRSYRTSINESAQLAFAVNIAQFEKTAGATDALPEAWQLVAQGFEAAGREHASSDLAPFFKAFEADALAHAGDQAKAQELLVQALAGMSSSNPLYYLYKIKAAVVSHNNDELRALADDMHNPHRALAWYHIWHQAFVAADREASQAAYAKLAGFAGSGSQWASLAQAQMECLA